jgi:spermidine synthase
VYLLFTAFICGGVILVVEFIGTYMLAPFFGSALHTWCAVISVTLAALAAGYAVGGYCADRFMQPGLAYALLLFAAILLLLVPVLAGAWLPRAVQFESFVFAVLLSSVLLFFPVLLLLAAIGPLVIRQLTHDVQRVGFTSGAVFACSTLGSLTGALLAGFYLAANFGVRDSFMLCAMLLAGVAVCGLALQRSVRSALFVLGCSLATALYVNAGLSEQRTNQDLLARANSYYGQMQIFERFQTRHLIVNGIAQNYTYQNSAQRTHYVNFVSALPVLHDTNASASRALVLGLGAGEIPTLFGRIGLHTEVVEIDPVITQLATDYFGFEYNRSSVFHMDARRFLNSSQATYDIIVLDTYSADMLPQHLYSNEAFALMRDHLNTHGLLVVNLTSIVGDADVNSVYAGLIASFPHVSAYYLPAEALTSIVLVASPSPVKLQLADDLPDFFSRVDIAEFLLHPLAAPQHAQALSDDFNPLNEQRTQARIIWRAQMQQYLGKDSLDWLIN